MRFEVDLHDCDITGRVPAALDGAFYRLHLDWLYPPKYVDDTPLAADGYMSMFRLKGGRAHYKGRYVRTERYRNQIDAGRQVYGYYRNPFTDDPSVRDIEHPNRRTTANTTPVLLAGRLYATKEDGLPYEMNPDTLETRSQTDFGGVWKSQTFTAHPKLDPMTGETIGYGYEATGLCSRDVFVCCLDRAGKITRQWQFEAPHASVLHDMWLTADHIVIPGGGLVTDLERAESGRPALALGSLEAIVVRRDSAQGNESGHPILLRPGAQYRAHGECPYGGRSHRARSRRLRMGIRGRSFLTSLAPRTCLCRTRFGGSRSICQAALTSVHEETLFETPMSSFVRIDERFLHTAVSVCVRSVRQLELSIAAAFWGAPMATASGGSMWCREGRVFFPWTGVVRFTSRCSCRVRRLVRKGMVICWRLLTTWLMPRTELHVIDAVSMEGLAVVTLPFRSAPQVHGVWARAGELA